ncbi:putative transcriptional regulator [Janthinobacterium sp. CG_23.3]|uniref:hypothetical protein n=1 Tax=Janthinobacterium sp. CG_23.3 TaxID=3349634 RepID=UPI0038D47DB8
MMDVEQTIPVESSTVLSKTDQRRLERLAKLAGRTPQSMLRFVLRDGFAACEESVLESQKADHEFATGKSFDHAEVMRSARQLLNAHEKRHGQAD